MRQCCNDECIDSKNCELKARERWPEPPSLLVMFITNPMVIFSVGFLLGLLFGAP